MTDEPMYRHAQISDDGLYRYWLTRKWTDDPVTRFATFIMLNPSVADATDDDNTIRRCIKFAQREGCNGLKVVNLYAYIATEPEDMFAAADEGVDIVGPLNDAAIEYAVLAADGPIIAGWGVNATNPHRVYKVKQLPGMERAQALKITKNGQPGHPLYIKGDAPLLPLNGTR